MYEAKLSSKNQIVIPRDARNALRIKAGDRLLVVVRGDTVILLRKPKNYSKAISETAKGIYSSDYLEKERESWR
ncbi:MAG TPA: AbrB/MazE/SpoVT family DNA-binding domain-containing protein [Thermodesulfobacteriota bacterium]|nr:AbrB/MazE/SpoVT family DNA-binding domain-containing protein [Thermodesulfobacteriota bacterium]